MKDLALKIVSSPAVRKAFIGLVLAIAAAAGLSLGGCGAAGNPARFAEAQCAARILAANAGKDPEQLTVAEVRALVAEFKACQAPAEAADAGADAR